ncbi:MAG: hypothetical protein AAF694_26775 [Bacteroidota bacterium]
MSKNAIYPATLMTLIAAYIALLAYKASNQGQPTPDYDFYDTTYIHVNILPQTELYDVYGVYNNILEGQRELVKAQITSDSLYKLAFQVNSPRPGIVYINNEAINVFLAPDSSLQIDVRFNATVQEIDSIGFSGYTADISRYYKRKSLAFNHSRMRAKRHTIPADDFCEYAATLDSMAQKERTFLALFNLDYPLPAWFVGFERSEIAYHKAYLKLSGFPDSIQTSECLDKIPLSDENAKFSYYYYLYVKSYIKRYLENSERDKDPNEIEMQLAVADTLLEGEVHDLFLTRSIFELLRRSQNQLAKELMSQYENSFNSKKYFRFLDYQLKALEGKHSS